jgi:uncharacterized repeat protein (TIGR03847 family)
MPRVVYRHDDVSRFIVSAIGQPGEREFFIQVKSMDGINTIAVEKEQVRVLSEQIHNLVVELRRSGLIDKDQLSVSPKIDNEPLEIPIEPDFELGIASIAWKKDVIEITFQAISSDDFILLDDLDEGPDLVIANLPIDIAKGFCLRADDLVSKGRSACPFCGLPINLSGHLCPRANGYRR